MKSIWGWLEGHWPRWDSAAVLTLFVIALAAVADGAQAFAVFRPLEREGFWWVSLPAMLVGLVVMVWFAYLAVTTRHWPSLAGAVLMALVFLVASWAYIRLSTADDLWTQAAKAVRLALPTTGGVMAAVAYGLVQRAKANVKEKDDKTQIVILDKQIALTQAQAVLTQAQADKRAKLNEAKRLSLPSLTVSETRTRQVSGSGRVALPSGAANGKYLCTCGWSTDDQHQYAGHRLKCRLAIAERAKAGAPQG